MKPKSRRSRKRTRRPKFLSLRLQLSSAATAADAADKQKQVMNFFPLQPGTTASLLDDKDHDNNVARFFAAADGCATTLTGLLPAAEGVSPETEEAASPSSMSVYSDRDSSMLRAALRSREREEEEEIRWVRMSEVVGERKAEEEVSSRAAAEGDEMWWLARRREGGGVGGGGVLSLKLDYKEVLEAWCGKGRPFWRGDAGEGPQTVPELQLQDDFFYHDINVANGGFWQVPDQNSCVRYEKEENQEEAIEGRKAEHREASVQRYKEKRMNRLFSKRIRYEVRKLNAEKRPRLKGRFVKRS